MCILKNERADNSNMINHNQFAKESIIYVNYLMSLNEDVGHQMKPQHRKSKMQ